MLWLHLAPSFAGVVRFFSLPLLVCLSMYLGAVWLKRRFMWRLRNRLIIAYVFVAVIPIVLVATMAFISGYLFSGQFTAYVVSSQLRSSQRLMEIVNHGLGYRVDSFARSGHIDGPPGLETAIYRDGVRLASTANGAKLPWPVDPSGAHLPDGVVFENHRFYLRSVLWLDDHTVVLSSRVIDEQLLSPIANSLGVIHFMEPRFSARGEQMVGEYAEEGTLHVGKLAGSTFYGDYLLYPAWLDAHVWPTGHGYAQPFAVQSRPSLLCSCIFNEQGEYRTFAFQLLAGIAIFFALIEAGALMIGVKLSRTMTGSVSNLYEATVRVNTGDLSHRIQVERSDQLAELERSFNSMTASLERLMLEQKEKQKIENELAIAHEVQELLFPSDAASLNGLELHGVCRPARTVSGDYYDFLPLGPGRIGLAVGDISGKGISAALLMATVHAYVRAHALSDAASTGDMTPASLLTQLNRQLYQSTPAEKYATMFLGFYDEQRHELLYANAGHLPPIILGANGSVRKLEKGGTVVGLFPETDYDEEAVPLNPGDLFISYSDGVTEPENDFGEFGVDRLLELVRSHRNEPLDRLAFQILAAVNDWTASDEQSDDITVMLARAR